ncbi:melanoma-associated antigen B3 [Ictidomys tridecemlineatus]|uniref:melanoma-associated antigen B3-like n=1 Tax=Ictidomys tridecemlineatus TaxID=43179 RepID=UPI000B543CFA|nr:melanoma-associated antigen B3-like [Ictidomys tridecemlineatus]KAG3271875.1 melanoma-associated antigen B3-like [Ictidomys tridecemlineatus]
MPRSQKSKRCTREEHHQVQGEIQDLRMNAQASENQEKIAPPSSSHLGVITRKSSASRSQSAPKVPEEPSSSTIPVSIYPSRSPEGANCKIKKKQQSSQSPPSSMQPHKDSLTKTTSILVQFMMHMYKMKRPILKVDMLKIINKKHKNRFLEILRRASFSIEVVFGVDLKEVDSTKNAYVLVSKMNLPNNGIVSRGRGFPKTGLLMNLLGVIFMKGNCATEENIWEFLNKMRLYAGKRHFIFGEPRKLITQDLVKLQYLEYRQVPDSDPARYEFLWGPRAHAETSKMKVLEFWAKINHTEPSAFQSWYDEALRDEEERAQAILTLSESTTTASDCSRAMSHNSSHTCKVETYSSVTKEGNHCLK